MQMESRTNSLSHERLHQLQRLLPQSPLLLFIIRMRRITRLIRRGIGVDYTRNLAILEVLPALTIQSLSSSCPDCGCSTLLRAFERFADVRVLIPCLHRILVDVRHETSEDQTRMNRPCVYTLACVSTVEFSRTVDVGCLALAVG